MRIAIDCRLFSMPLAEETFSLVPLIRSLLEMSTGDEFFLIFDQTPSSSWHRYANTRSLVLKPAAKTAATRALWYDLRVPALLSGHQIDLFVGTSGYISLRTPVKQLLVLHDMLSGEAFPSATGWPGSWYRRRLPAMLQKAALRFVSATAQVPALGPGAIPLGFEVLPFCPQMKSSPLITDDDKQKIKGELTAGAEYFYCEEGWNNTDDAVDLLLAFSAFKKRMQTGMKLLLAGNGPESRDWNEKLASYRYREDVVIVPGEFLSREKNRVLSASYALVHLPAGPKTRLLQQALCLGIPVITWPHEVIREMAGDAVLYCTDNPGESLAQNLMRMYKDEKWRSECIKKGLSKAENWDTEVAAGAFYKTALTTMG